jgi:tetratricopeptide (TPR) repeat protein
MNSPPAKHDSSKGILALNGWPGALVFDDEPLAPLLNGDERSGATPASVIDLWDTGIDRSPECARAFVVVLTHRPDLLDQIEDLEAAESCFREALNSSSTNPIFSRAACWGLLGRILERRNLPQEAEFCYRDALAAFGKEDFAAAISASTIANRLILLLEKSGRQSEAHLIRARIRTSTLLDTAGDNFDALRREALALFTAGHYEGAEAIYRHMLENGFELGSTHCHLARVLLMMDRETEAREQVEKASAIRATGPIYVVVRVQILKVLFQMLAGEEWKTQLPDLKESFASTSAHLD